MSFPNRFIQAVALDMDGLSLNTEELYGESGKRLMARRGKEFRDEVRQGMTGLPAREAYAVLIEAEELTESWEELHRETEGILAELMPSWVKPMPGLEALLDELDRLQLPRCIATSSSRAFASQALGLAGVLDRIDFIVTAEDVLRGKPAPDIYRLAATRMNSLPSRMLVLEDSPTGARSGIDAECFVVAIPSSHVSHHEFGDIRFKAKQLDAPEIFEVLQRKHLQD
jgi:HAD superfamily hydrolase (TIGR01509 family)